MSRTQDQEGSAIERTMALLLRLRPFPEWVATIPRHKADAAIAAFGSLERAYLEVWGSLAGVVINAGIDDTEARAVLPRLH